MDYLYNKAIVEHVNKQIWIKPLDYYDKMLNYTRKELSRYCLTYIEDFDWNNLEPNIKIILDGWVIYKENHSDVGIGSDECFLQNLKSRFEVTDLCSRSFFQK